MRLVTGHDELVAAWMEAFTGRSYRLYFDRVGNPAQAVIGWIDNGALVSAAFFTNHHPAGSIEVHICGRLTRGCVRDTYRYAFGQLKVRRVSALIARSNALLRKKLPKLGFKYESVMKNQYGAEDAIVFRLDRAAAERWM